MVLRYFLIWAGLIFCLAAQLYVFTQPLTFAEKTYSILGIASMQSILVAVFLQQLTKYPRAIATFYLIAALTGLGLFIGMVVSVIHFH